MLKFSMIAFGCYLIFDGINAILTGVISPMIGSVVAASHELIIYQVSRFHFISEVTVHFIIGGALIITAVNLIRTEKN